MSDLYFSRGRLRARHGEALSAIAPLLIPDDDRARASHAHRILWLLFQETPDASRDFLWRDEGDGRYLILSQRLPTDPHDLFDLDTKPFAPALRSGDRLTFVLRANPIVASKGALDADRRARRQRGKKCDVVMHALHGVRHGERGPVRDRIAGEAGARWLTSQGAKAGFEVVGEPTADGYAHVDIERGRGRQAGFSVLNFAGEIAVTDPVLFVARLAKGFGSAKAFGNGLMLIRRA